MPLIIDTDVLIDYLRGQDVAVTYIESVTDEMSLSVITVAELYAGVREGKERTALDEFIKAFELVPLTTEIAIKGGIYRRDYGKVIAPE